MAEGWKHYGNLRRKKEKSKSVNIIAWHEFPRFEGEVQPEEELPFK